MIYIVTKGKYDDYQILGVFDNREKAEELVKKTNRYFTLSDGYEARIENWEIGETVDYS